MMGMMGSPGLPVIFLVAYATIVVVYVATVLCKKKKMVKPVPMPMFRVVDAETFSRTALESKHLTEAGGATMNDAWARNADNLEEARSRYVSSFRTDLASDAGVIAVLSSSARAADKRCVKGLVGTPFERWSADIARMPWNIAILDNSVENGYPHTMGNLVCLPSSFCTGLLHDSKTSRRGRFKRRVMTMLHEKVHVFQRTHPRSAREMNRVVGFERAMSFEAYREDAEMRNETVRFRSNPDLDAWLYVHVASGAMPAALYTKAYPDDLADVTIHDLNAVTPSHQRIEEHLHEHPHEHVAYKLSYDAFTSRH